MSFHQRNKNNLGENIGKIIFPIFILAIFLGIFSISNVRDFIFMSGSPLWHLKNNIGNFFEENILLLSSKSALLKENLSLKREIEAKKNDQILGELIKQENIDLKNILNRKIANQNLILATILIRPFLSTYDTMILDIGENDGLEVGNKVLANGNIFIGYISEVYENTSKVVLYSSFGERTRVSVGNNNIEKEAIGLGGGNFSIEISKEINIKEGDPVVFPSISPNVFGIVEKVSSKESDSEQTILLKVPVNIFELKWVEVLLNNK